MSIFSKYLGKSPQPQETRSASSSWDLMRSGVDFWSDSGVPISPYLAENLSVVFACVQVISETIAMLPLNVYRGLRAATAKKPHRTPWR